MERQPEVVPRAGIHRGRLARRQSIRRAVDQAVIMLPQVPAGQLPALEVATLFRLLAMPVALAELTT